MMELTERAIGLRQGEYRGVRTIATYSDPGQEFRALTRGVAVFRINWRPKLLVSGRDRVRWLNGMVTNNVRDLPPGEGVYSFVLTPQGRILGDMYTYNRGDFLVLDTDYSQVQNLLPILRKYIIMDQVEISEAADKWNLIGVAGPKSTELLARVGLQIPSLRPLQAVDLTWRNLAVTIVRGDLPHVDSYELWEDPANANKLWEELLNAGAVPAGSDAVERLRIACAVPRYGQDIRERDLPQETEQMRALSFTKGCYIGQEIVERIRSRGAVHRKFTGFRIDGSLPAPGSKAQADGKEIAEITSAGLLPTVDGEVAVALGYVRREAGVPGKEIEIGGAKATVVDFPFKEVFESIQGR